MGEEENRYGQYSYMKGMTHGNIKHHPKR